MKRNGKGTRNETGNAQDRVLEVNQLGERLDLIERRLSELKETTSNREGRNDEAQGVLEVGEEQRDNGELN